VHTGAIDSASCVNCNFLICTLDSRDEGAAYALLGRDSGIPLLRVGPIKFEYRSAHQNKELSTQWPKMRDLRELPMKIQWIQ